MNYLYTLKKAYRNYSNTSGVVLALHFQHVYFVLIPKVACSTLTAIAVDVIGFNLPEQSWKPSVFRDNRFDNIIDTKFRDDAMLVTRDIEKLKNYWGFALVRNPYDRLVSCFSEKIRDDIPIELCKDGVSKVLSNYGVFSRGMSFESFAKEVVKINDFWADPHFRSQSTFLFDEYGRKLVDHIGYFENLTEEANIVYKKLNISFELPHLLKSSRMEWKSYYSDSLRELVYERYRKDFEIFGYDK